MWVGFAIVVAASLCAAAGATQARPASLRRRSLVDWCSTRQPPAPDAAAKPSAKPPRQDRPVRLSWAKLLKRVFDLDLEHCPNCGGELKIIAAILEQPVIEKILTHLGLQARAPPRSAARGQALQAA